MTRLRPNNHQRAKLHNQRVQDMGYIHTHQASPPITNKRSRFGFQPTAGETTPLQMAIRFDNAMRRRKVKPSMPKMPWEDTNGEA